MTTTIYKLPLMLAGEATVNLQRGAKILCVQMQAEVPTMWYECDPAESLEPRRILMYGTGQRMMEFDKRGPYLGTLQVGIYVLHVYEGEPQ